MTTTTLPRDLELYTVEMMAYREVGYVMPEAIIVSQDRRMWLCYDAWVEPEPDEEHDMKVERTKHAVIVYRDTIINCKYPIAEDYLVNDRDFPIILK